MKLIEQKGVRYLVSGLLAGPGLVHGFSTRVGGVSRGRYASLNLWHESGDNTENVLANRKRLAATLGMAPALPITARQVHGDRILEVTDPDPGQSLTGDGLVTNRAGVFISVGSADCVPILLWDPVRRAAGAVHTGWKGTQFRIAKRAVETMTRLFDSRPEAILAAIGPAAGPCCYEVGNDVARRFSPDFLVRQPDGRVHLDLWQSNLHQLLEAGLRSDHIETAGLCTLCRGDLFFSYRRDGARTGGMLAVIGIRG